MDMDLRKLPQSRAAAMMENSKFFVSGPCLRGHVAARYTSSGKCLACQYDPHLKARHLARQKRWREENPIHNAHTKRRARDTDRARRHVTKVLISSAHMDADSYRRLVSSKALIISATMRDIERNIYCGKLATKGARLERWHDQKTQWKSNKHRRKSHLQDAGTYTRAQVRLLLDAQGHECAYCRARSGLTIDHMRPLARGGSNRASNLQWLCLSHNSSKCDKTDSEYRALYGDTLKPLNTLAGYYRLLFLIMEGNPHAKTKERKPACAGITAIPGSERTRLEILSGRNMPERPSRGALCVKPHLLPLQHGSIESPQRGKDGCQETRPVQRHSRLRGKNMRACENKAAARDAGKATYRTGITCQACGTDRHYVANGNCVECAKDANRRFSKSPAAQAANRERQARYRARQAEKKSALIDDI